MGRQKEFIALKFSAVWIGLEEAIEEVQHCCVDLHPNTEDHPSACVSLQDQKECGSRRFGVHDVDGKVNQKCRRLNHLRILTRHQVQPQFFLVLAFKQCCNTYRQPNEQCARCLRATQQ